MAFSCILQQYDSLADAVLLNFIASLPAQEGSLTEQTVYL